MSTEHKKPATCAKCKNKTWTENWFEWTDKDLGLVGGIFCQTCYPKIKKEKADGNSK